MNRSVGVALHRTVAGGIIFALGLGGVALIPQAPLPARAANAATSPGRLALVAVDSLPSTGSEPHHQLNPIVVVTTASATATATPAHPLRAAPITAAVAAPVRPVAGNGAGFAFGYCTWWVAHKRYVPWRGNAAQWWWNARAFGYAEGSVPRPGAIMVMAAGGSASPEGHVAYVESVNADGSFVVSEMNWWGVPGGGWGRVDYRTVRSMAGILGFIY